MFEVTHLNTNTVRVVRPSEARDRVGVSRAKFADMIAKGNFLNRLRSFPGAVRSAG